MVFRIVDMDKSHRKFMVQDEAGKTLTVTGIQIVSVLASGSTCVNACLIRDGFKIMVNPTNIVEIKPSLNDDLRKIVNNLVKQREMAVKAQREAEEQMAATRETAARVISTPQIRVVADNSRTSKPVQPKVKQDQPFNYNIKRTITGSNEPVRERRISNIPYKGTLYLTPESLCKAYKCTDVEKFKKLYRLGYTVGQALGIDPIEKGENPIPLEKKLDVLLRNVGKYDNM